MAGPAAGSSHRRKFPIELRDVEFLRANTDRRIKITVPGPFTMAQQAQNDFYEDEQEMVLDYAAAVNAEIKDLFAAGADIVQIDEPYMQARPEKARKYGLLGIETALDGITGATAIHICFGYAEIIHVRPKSYSFLPELAGSRLVHRGLRIEDSTRMSIPNGAGQTRLFNGAGALWAA
jgi:5-methyltetrahydropteroyltriglutamate--homocysteine methyltransferase